MKILTNLVIATLPSKYANETDKPFVLWIEGHGRVGDKFNQRAGKHGRSFPPEASDRFATRGEAVAAFYKFREYVEDVIASKKDGKASCNLWE